MACCVFSVFARHVGGCEMVPGAVRGRWCGCVVQSGRGRHRGIKQGGRVPEKVAGVSKNAIGYIMHIPSSHHIPLYALGYSILCFR